MDGNLNQVDLNQCIRIAPKPVFDEAAIGVQSRPFHAPHPIPSSSPTNSSTLINAPTANVKPESYSMDQVRANLELLQRKHSEKRKKAEEHRHARLEVQLPSDQPAAMLTEFGRNRPSTGLTPTLTSPQSSPSPTSFPHRMIDGIDLSNREALNELSLSTVQRLHDKLRDQILTEMQVELNESQTFDQVVKQGFHELELKKRQLSQHETLSQAADQQSLPPSISTISATSSRVPSHESVHISSGSFNDDSLSLPPSHPIHTRSSSSNSSIQSSPSPASAATSSKPRHLSVAVPKEDFTSPPPLSTHSHPHSTRHSAVSNIHSTRSNHSGKQFVSPHPHIPQHHESQASYVRQLLTNNARDHDHLHPGVKAIVDIISPKASPAAAAVSSTRSSTSHSQSFRFGVPPEMATTFEGAGVQPSPRVNSPSYASGTSSHRFDRFLSSDSLQQEQQQQQQQHHRSASNSSASSSTSTPSQAKYMQQQQSAASVPGTSVNSSVVTPSSSIPFAALTRVRTPHDGFRQSFALHPSAESGAPISASHIIRTSSSPSTGSPPSASEYYATPSPPSLAMPQRPPPLHSTGSPMAGSITSIASPVPVGGVTTAHPPPPSGKRRWSPLKERGRASHTPSPSSARLQQQLLNASPTPSSSMGSTLLFPAQQQSASQQPTLIYAVPVTPGSEMALPPGGEFFYAMHAPISATNVATTPFFGPPMMMPPLSTTAAGSVASSSFDWNVAPMSQAFTPTSSSPMLTSPSPPHHQQSGGRVKFSPVPPSQPRPQSESLARRSSASPSAAFDQSSPPPLERSKTAGHIPSGGGGANGLGATPTSAARMKRMKSMGAAIASMPSPQSAQERVSIKSQHVSHPTTAAAAAAPLQLGNWTQIQGAAAQQTPMVNLNSSSAYTARVSPTNKSNGKLFSSSSIAHAPHPSTARHHNSASSNQPSASRAAIDAATSSSASFSSSSSQLVTTGSKSSKKTLHGKFHPGNAISNLKARRVADKEKTKSHKQQMKAASSTTRIGVPTLSLDALDSRRSSGGLPSAIAEGDEVAAAALSARLASMGLGSGSSSVDSARSGGGKKNHKSPQMGSRYFASPRKGGSDLSHLEIEEEASLAGMEHQRPDSPIPYPPSNESRTTTSDEEIEEEEHLRHGVQHNNYRR